MPECQGNLCSALLHFIAIHCIKTIPGDGISDIPQVQLEVHLLLWPFAKGNPQLCVRGGRVCIRDAFLGQWTTLRVRADRGAFTDGKESGQKGNICASSFPLNIIPD